MMEYLYYDIIGAYYERICVTMANFLLFLMRSFSPKGGSKIVTPQNPYSDKCAISLWTLEVVGLR